MRVSSRVIVGRVPLGHRRRNEPQRIQLAAAPVYIGTLVVALGLLVFAGGAKSHGG